MARAKTSDQPRSRSKAATIEELTRGVGKFQEFLAQVEDLGQEGFPYLDAARARTELQFRECIRRTFGEKSTEFQEYRHHKLLMDSPEDTQQSIALIKTLIATLEQKKRDLQGEPLPPQIPLTPAAASMIPARPQMTLVPASIPTVHMMTVTQPTPATPPPMIMSIAVTTNPDLPSATAAANPPPLPFALPGSLVKSEPLIPSPSQVESSPVSPAPATTTISDTPQQPVTRLAPASLHPLPQTPQPALPDSSHLSKPLRREPEPTVHPTPSAKPQHQMQEPPSVPTPLQLRPSMSIDSSSHQEPAPKPPHADADPVELVKTLCRRFHAVARQLRLRGEYRATLSVEDEFDAQDLLHVLLRIQFDDIGTYEWTPSYSGGAPRTTFLLNDGRLAVIVKKTRPGLNTKDLTDQLRIDAERYRSHGRCTTLLCFMYDPEGRIGNPRGFESNLTSVSDSFVIEILVSPK